MKTPFKRSVMRLPRRWDDSRYIVDGSIVGTVDEDVSGRGYWAYGCMSDWQDTNLGLHERESTARGVVEQWVKENT